MIKCRQIFINIALIVYVKSFSQNTVPQNANTKEKVGWIPFDKSIDKADFVLCDEFNIEEYYQVNPSYQEGMYSIRKYFALHEKELNSLCKVDGYLIIRFVINCKGLTDRYRSKFLSYNYTEQADINTELQKKLIALVSQMGTWIPGEYQGKKYDAYQHIKFKFQENKLIDILF